MSMQIAVSDPLPIFGRGLLAAIGRADHDLVAREHLLAWARQERRRVVFLTLDSSEDWALLAELQETQTDLLVVAVLVEATIQASVRAILTGAVAVVPRDASPESLRQVFEAVVEGRSLLPVDVVRALVTARALPEDGEAPSARDIEWLRQLAGGRTVSQLADRSGYSERAMYRQLKEVYDRIGVGNRTQALLRAYERGWLSAGDFTSGRPRPA
jgi:DNA-binding NarL/FixJ family response regulator